MENLDYTHTRLETNNATVYLGISNESERKTVIILDEEKFKKEHILNISFSSYKKLNKFFIDKQGHKIESFTSHTEISGHKIKASDLYSNIIAISNLKGEDSSLCLASRKLGKEIVHYLILISQVQKKKDTQEDEIDASGQLEYKTEIHSIEVPKKIHSTLVKYTEQ